MPTSTRPGDVLVGRYRLVDLLSESRGGRFWRAHDAVLSRHVALHVISTEDERARGLLDAARRSATTLDRRILRVLDAEERNGLCVVVNEWGEGVSLDIMLSGEGPLEPRRAAWLVSEVASAIAHAHDSGQAHGRLVPENVLLDHTGTVRIIGFAVDAALVGLPPGRRTADVADLAALLYAALTGKWPGVSRSDVPPAPVEGGRVLRPRKVRAGIPRVLDAICDEALNPPAGRGSHLRVPYDLTMARGLADALRDFVGDPTELAAAEAARGAAPRAPIAEPQEATVAVAAPPFDTVGAAVGVGDDGPDVAAGDSAEISLSPAAALTEAQTSAAPKAGEAEAPADRVESTTEQPSAGERAAGSATADPAASTGGEPAARPAEASAATPEGRTRPAVDQPTQAGMPIFHDSREVSWMPAREEPPPPPPPFEDPPARPLFAPDPPQGQPVRRARAAPAGSSAASSTGTNGEFWPWDTMGTGTGTSPVAAEGTEEVPGRSWLRLAMVIATSCVLLLAVVAAVNLGRGRTPLGGESADGPAATTAAAPQRIDGVTAEDFDPQGSPAEENPDEAPLVVDGDPATTWQTMVYEQELGPGGLKTGVGLLLDLGGGHDLRTLTAWLVGGSTDLEVYVADDRPRRLQGLTEVGSGSGSGRLRIPLEEATGRFVVVWLTSLPPVTGGFQGEVGEVVVTG